MNEEEKGDNQDVRDYEIEKVIEINEEEYNEYVKNCKSASLYDTGKTAKYGEQLMTLSTCSYHTEDGRLAVVARKK